jgi:lipoprotein-anchoring transpeptidase ErfK/SrfK
MPEEGSLYQRRLKPPPKEGQIYNLLRLGILAADVGRRTDARACFAAVLDMDPNNEQALLWQAGLADDPRESLAYLARVLTINPRNEYAKAGIRWARKRVTRFEQAGRRGQGPPRPVDLTSPAVRARGKEAVKAHRARRLISSIGGAILLCVLAILVGGLFALFGGDDQEAVRAALLPTTVPTAAFTATLRPTFTATATDTPTPTLTHTLTPTPTDTPVPTDTPTPTDTLTPSPAPTVSPTDTPTFTPPPTDTPSPQPTATPTIVATEPPTPTPPPPPTLTPTSPPPPPTLTPASPPVSASNRWIDINLSSQSLAAYEGDLPVYWASVSTGTRWTPTVTGRYHIYLKVRSQTMSGPGYRLPNVPHVMFFYKAYALHGTYWHNNFGQPMSHGCVNLRTEDAQWLYEWSGPAVPPGKNYVRASDENPGTLVVVHY